MEIWLFLGSVGAFLGSSLAAYLSARWAAQASSRRSELAAFKEALTAQTMTLEKVEAMQRKLASRLNLREYRDRRDGTGPGTLPDWRSDPAGYIAQVSKQRGLIAGVAEDEP